MLIAPDAKLDDGYFEVVNIGDLGTLKILLKAHTLYRGTHVNLPEVRVRRAKRIEIRQPIQGVTSRSRDRWRAPGCLPAVYEIVPKAISIRVPV